MYAKHGAAAVCFEVGRMSAKGGHAHVQVVPVPNKLAGTVEDVFRQEAGAAGVAFEEDADEALRAAEGFRRVRIPRFLKYFQSVLAANAEAPEGKGKGTYLVGGQTTMGDLVLFHVVDGISFAYPRRMAQLREGGEYANVFALYERVKGEKGIKEYIESGRRQKFSMGLFRYYKELDGEEKEG